MTAIEDEPIKAEKFDWWNDVYGFNFGSMLKPVYMEPLKGYANSEPQIVVANQVRFKTFDLYTVWWSTRVDMLC